MKRILLVFAVLFLSVNLVYALGERPAKVTELQTNNFELINLKVEGITCPSCILTIRGALQKVPAVKKAEVNLQGEAKVYMEKGKVNPTALIQAVNKAGYKATLAE